jgi:protein subunit release factor B
MTLFIEELVITYSRSSGPGGQNVNTVSTKVDLRLHLESANWLHPDVKSKILESVSFIMHNYAHKYLESSCKISTPNSTRTNLIRMDFL